MTSREIRRKFLEFYKERGHAEIPSASLIPENDPTLLFVNSGMFPLVPYFLGESHPAGKRLTDSQKSFRAEDIGEIGDNRHNTFFEMLGNWSLGDYFKEEQFDWWYEFLIKVLKLDPEKIYQTIYVGDPLIGIKKDEDSIRIVKNIFEKYGIEAEEGPETTGDGSLGPGIPVDFSTVRIMAYRDKNWWKRGDAVGELGGPDSETFYDTGRSHDKKFGEYCHLNCDCGKFMEIGNSVFMQYKRTKFGWEEIKSKNVDFGGGLERILMVENGKSNVFETDLFEPIIRKTEELSEKKYSDDPRSFEIIADHLKAAVFIIGDEKGVVPSNVGRGYIVRRLVRRAVRYGRQIGVTESGWTKSVLPAILGIYEGIYPELGKNKDFIAAELEKEELKFAKTLEAGIGEFEKMAGKGKLSGKTSFYLYQSYGLPKEDIEELCGQKGIPFDSSGFDEEFRRHQELSRTSSAGMFKGGLADSSEAAVRFHTTSHLLLAALRRTLGDHVLQKGSNITSARLRFDFSHPQKMTDGELKKTENMINGWIKEDIPVISEEMPLDEARRSGAMGVFDDRYGNNVKIYSIGGISKEICGGPHVGKTSDLGKFTIIKEESVSAGIRRIKAVLE